MFRKSVSLLGFILLIYIPLQGYGNDPISTDSKARFVPKVLNYQGYLTDTLGIPIDDTLDMTFNIFDDSSAGIEWWSETQSNIPIIAGIFHVILGNNIPIPDSVFVDGSNRWLELILEGPVILSPRTRMTSAGYAYISTYSDTAEYARSMGADNDWSVTDSVLYTDNYWGIARGGVNNVLHGTYTYSHLNLGIVCTTGHSVLNERYCTVGGGYGNSAIREYTTVSGGYSNRAFYDGATVGGGYDNLANGDYSTVAGGQYNTANGDNAAVTGGYNNNAARDNSFIGGGGDNLVEGAFSVIAGGYADTITSDAHYSYLFGIGSKLNADSTFLVDMPHIQFGDEANGYEFPTQDGSPGYLLVTDGSGQLYWYSDAGGKWTVSDSVLYTESYWGLARGGGENVLYGSSAYTHTNFGGYACTTGISSDDFAYTTICGGYGNRADSSYSAAVGGFQNKALGRYSFIGCGQENSTNGLRAGVICGSNNVAGGSHSFVGSGYNNTTSDIYAFIGGGSNNNANANNSVITGGGDNFIEGDYAAILGGKADSIMATADYSYLFGIGSKLTEDSTFMVDMPHIRFGNETNGYEFPSSNGSVDQILITDGSGYLAWSDVPPDTDWIISGVDMYTGVSGNIGIGNTNPTSKLTINGEVSIGNSYTGTAAPANGMIIEGQVGIGTSSPNPTSQLSVLGGTSYAIYGEWSGSSGGAAMLVKNTGTGGDVIQALADGSGRSAIWARGSAGIDYSIYADDNGATWAGYFDGDVNISGDLIVSGVIPTDQDWERGGINDTVLFTGNMIGIARGGAGNELYGDSVHTHVNFGTACTTSSFGTANAYVTVSGGHANRAIGSSSTISGGEQNKALGNYTIVAGGRSNSVSYSEYGSVLGGFQNYANANYSVIGGGYADTVNARFGGILSGYRNTAGDNIEDSCATIVNGRDNEVTDKYAFVGNGNNNTSSNDFSSIINGVDNSASGTYSIIVGGSSHTAIGSRSFIGNGYMNSTASSYSFIGSGYDNDAANSYVFVGGGYQNRTSGYRSFIGNGYRNTIDVNGQYGFIGCGYGDSVFAYYGGILAGRQNIVGDEVSDSAAVVVGGRLNEALAKYSFVGGGYDNSATGDYSTVAGGNLNTASGHASFIGGGQLNVASASRTFAAGFRAKANHSDVFVWADGTAADFASSASNQFLIRATGGVGIGLNDPGAQLDIGGVARIRGMTWPSTGEGMEMAYNSTANRGYIQVYDRDAAAWGVLYLGNGKVGIGIADPTAHLDVVGDDTLGRLLIAPAGTNVDDDAELLLGENETYTHGMSIKYDGGTNQLGFYGNSSGTIYGPHMTIERNDGDICVGATSSTARLYVNAGSVVGKEAVYGYSSNGEGGYFSNNNNDYYALTAWNSFGSGGVVRGLYVHGHAYATGGYQTDFGGKQTGFSVTSADREIIISGSSSLKKGTLEIQFPADIRSSISKDIAIIVTVTPTSECNGMYISKKSSTGFNVKELMNGGSNATFDWIAIARVRGYEKRMYTPPLAQKSQVTGKTVERDN
ncbi:MAG: hypothetical protein WBB37_09880 [bacterium]